MHNPEGCAGEEKCTIPGAAAPGIVTTTSVGNMNQLLAEVLALAESLAFELPYGLFL